MPPRFGSCCARAWAPSVARSRSTGRKTSSRLLADFEDSTTRKVVQDGEEREVVVSRVYPTTHFGFRKITVERPLKLDFQASSERIARLDDERAFVNLAVSRKKGAAKAGDEAAGREQQAAIRTLLQSLPDTLFLDRAIFEAKLSEAARKAKLKLTAPIRKAILSALSERNDEAEICLDREGRPEPDPELRDTENMPLLKDVESFFEREVKPHVRDAWIDTTRRDPQDGEVGLVGYEINFNRYFYEYCPPRPREEIEADIQQVEKEIVAWPGLTSGGDSPLSLTKSSRSFAIGKSFGIHLRMLLAFSSASLRTASCKFSTYSCSCSSCSVAAFLTVK